MGWKKTASSLSRKRLVRADRKGNPQCKAIFAMFAQRTEGFSSGGKKTASSLSRKRLMRGDQSPLTIGILLAEWLCTFDVWKFRIKHHNESHSAYQSGAIAAPCNKFAPPAQARTSPQDPRHQKGETNLRSCNGGGLVGKFGEGQGGLEGRRPSPKEGLLRLQGLPHLSVNATSIRQRSVRLPWISMR